MVKESTLGHDISCMPSAVHRIVRLCSKIFFVESKQERDCDVRWARAEA